MISDMLRFPFTMTDDDLDNLFYPTRLRREKSRQGVYPAINVGVSDQSVDVYAFVPGMNAEDFELVIEKDLLSIQGRRKPIELEEGSNWYAQERFTGDFKRVITLPEAVDEEHVQAVYRNGVLHINIAKRVEAQPRQIKIDVQ